MDCFPVEGLLSDFYNNISLLVPVVIMSDGKLALGYKQWAGNRSAFGEIFASGNCTKITELQAGAQGHLGKP